jgi:hypothetical protein
MGILYPQGGKKAILLGDGVMWTQYWTGHCGQEKNCLCSYQEFNPDSMVVQLLA